MGFIVRANAYNFFSSQMIQKFLLENSKFEGEVDYEDNLPISIIKELRND